MAAPFAPIIVGVITILCAILCRNSEKKPNRPPIITCGSPQPSDNVVAEALATSAVVTWNDPSHSDPDGDSVSLDYGKLKSGSSFEQGYHTQTYTVSDSDKSMAACSISFKVTVNYCHESLYVRNGYTDCNPKDKIFGSVCDIHCNNGYNWTSNSVLKKVCEGTRFSSGLIECERKKCSAPMKICNGNFTCTNSLYEFETVCYPECNEGYKTEMNQHIQCIGDRWNGTEHITCEDAEPPVFDNFPRSIVRYADRGSDTATNVTWDEPIIMDNAQKGEACGDRSKPSLKQVGGSLPKSDFSKGSHLIKYEAIDGNEQTASFSFNIIVETISCDPLMPADKFLISRCPTGYTYGSTCYFTCFLSYILNGSKSVSCEIDKTGKHGIWAWANDTESFCEKLMCPDLPAPGNGSLACSTVLGNKVCTMGCNEKFQIPRKSTEKPMPSEFVCNQNQEWNGLPPNCTDAITGFLRGGSRVGHYAYGKYVGELLPGSKQIKIAKRNPNVSYKPGELLYFYSGDCSDTSVQQGIKEHFITVVEDMTYNRNYDNICPTFCNISNVIVTCGPTAGRRRRESEGTHFEKYFRRSTNEITLTFVLTMEWIATEDYWSNDAKISAVSETIKTISANGEFDYNGLSPSTIAFSFSSIGCEEGTAPNYYTETCTGCAPGSYLIKTTEECQDCSKGYYQDEEYQSACKQCPPGMSTEDVGSSSMADCKDICQPGTYSNTGVVPCAMCAIGEYQPLERSNSTCLKCTKGTFTEKLGSADVTDCKDFDVMIHADTQISFNSVDLSAHDFALSFWVFCPENCTSFIILQIMGFTFDVGKTLTISHSRTHATKLLDELNFKTWNKVILAWTQSNSELNVHVNEKIVLTKVFSSGIDGTAGQKLIILSSTYKIYLSGLVLHTHITSDIYTRTCTPVTTDAVYTMSDFLTTANSGIDFMESQCDEMNECSINPCGGGNICYNKKNGYNCTCLNGYRGSNCQTPPDFCIGHTCANGATCESQQTNYTCQCANGYKGPFCEMEIVNGGWSFWSGWSECSKSCDGGTRSRVRFCDSPTPESDGQFCIGNDTGIGNCNNNSCPVCKPYYEIKQFKNYFNCTTINDHISCTVTCQNGYLFLPEFSPRDKYECGNNTNYEWYDKPPACAPITFPIKLQTKYTIKYESSSCTNKVEIKNEMTDRVQSLQCVANATCQVSVDTNGCDDDIRRKRRSTHDLEVIVTFISTLNDSNAFDMEAVYESNIVSPELDQVIQKYTDQGITAQQMINNTDLYTIDVNGDVYTTNVSNINLTFTVSCSPGKVDYQAVCVACPVGTYWIDGFCIRCAVGTYQNETGQQKCETCPNGYTTLYTSSKKRTDCSEKSTFTRSTASTTSIKTLLSSTSNAASPVSEAPRDTDEESVPAITEVIIPGLIVTLLLATIIMMLVALFKYRKHIRRLNRKRQATSQSIASLNMIDPVFAVTSNDNGSPPVSTYTREQ